MPKQITQEDQLQQSKDVIRNAIERAVTENRPPTYIREVADNACRSVSKHFSERSQRSELAKFTNEMLKIRHIERPAPLEEMRDAPSSLPSLHSMPQLITELENDNQKVRSDAARALGEMGEQAKGAVPALIGALRSKGSKPEVRAEVAIALGKISGKGAVAALVHTIENENETDMHVKSCAIWALGEMGPKAAAASGAVRFVLETMKEQSKYEPDLFIFACRALGNMRATSDAAFALTETLQHKNELVRAEAAAALGRMGSEAKEATSALRDAMIGDRDVSVRANAATALGEIGQRDAFILTALKSVTNNLTQKEDPVVIASAQRSLAALSKTSRTREV